MAYVRYTTDLEEIKPDEAELFDCFLQDPNHVCIGIDDALLEHCAAWILRTGFALQAI